MMARRCSHCNNNGHNLRTCPSRSGGGCGGGGVKLFGVRLTDAPSMKKSASMGNLLHYNSSSPNPNSPSSDHFREPMNLRDGYLSDDPAHAACSSNRRADRKKGVPWTEEEHRLFLIGLRKLGKGDWRGIARNFVMSRTPTQVASHAQKYFIRQSNATRRKRRSSLFDIVPETVKDGKPWTEAQDHTPNVGDEEVPNFLLPPLDLKLKRDTEPMDATYQSFGLEAEATPMVPPMTTTLFPTYIPIPLPIWMPSATHSNSVVAHNVLKPTPVLRDRPLNIDELIGMSQLSLREADGGCPLPPSFKKSLGVSSRPSAFHVRPASNGSDLSVPPDGGGSPISAVQ